MTEEEGFELEELEEEAEPATTPVKTTKKEPVNVEAPRRSPVIDADTLISILRESKKERRTLMEKSLSILPNLNQNNPLTLLFLMNMMNQQDDDDIAKAVKAALIPKAVDKALREVDEHEGRRDALIEQLERLREENEKLRKVLLEKQQNEQLDALRQDLYNLIGEIVKSQQALQERLASLQAQPQESSSAPSDFPSMVEMYKHQIAAMQEALKSLGYDVKPPGSGGDDLERELKKEELELKRREFEVKQQVTQTLVGAVTELIKDPTKLKGLVEAFKLVVSPETTRGAMQQAAGVAQAPPTPSTSEVDIPSFEEFAGGEDGNAEGLNVVKGSAKED